MTAPPRPKKLRTEVAASTTPVSPSPAGTLTTSCMAGRHYDDFFQFLFGIDEKSFFAEYFQQKPLHYVRKDTSATKACTFFQTTIPPLCNAPLDWTSRRMVELCAEKELHYTTDINVVRYVKQEQKRIPFQLEGRVASDELRRCFDSEGWSVRFLRPQEHSHSMHSFISAMETVFQCSSGVNSYWTPKGTQGFAPHYDDVDVFLLQLEGSKRWRLYHPPEESDVLSRHSSEDYKQNDVGKPFMTTVLRAGDVLYMPRGTVHQGDTTETVPQENSLHVTFSAFQMHSMVDLMLSVTRFHLETLAANDVKWRRGVPRSWMTTLGAINSKTFYDETGMCALTKDAAPQRASNLKHIRALVTELSDALQDATAIDNAVDCYAKEVLAKFQPPAVPEASKVSSGTPLSITASVSLVSAECIRLVMYVPGEAQVYHTGSNSRVCLATPIGQLRFEREFAAAIATLIASFPKAVVVKDLPMPFESDEDADENRLQLITALAEAGVLVAKE